MRRSWGAVVVAVVVFSLYPAAAFAASAPGVPTAVTASAGVLSASVHWTPADSTATSFTVTSSPGGITANVDGSATRATVTGLGFATSYSFTVTGNNTTGTSPASAPSNPITPIPPGGQYHQGFPLVLFNRDLSVAKPLNVYLGSDPIRVPGLSAVVLNLTASKASVPTSVQLVVNRRTVQTLPVAPGQIESSLAVINMPATLTQSALQVTAGNVHVQADFVGYVSGPQALRDCNGLLKMVTAAPLFSGPVALSSTTSIAVLGQGGVPASHVAEVLLNVTATAGGGTGALVLRPLGGFATGVTTLGFTAGQTTANRAIVAVPASGVISLVDRGAAATARVEVLGWFSDGSDPNVLGSLYTGLAPARVLDTAAQGGPVGPGGSMSFPILGQAGVPPLGAVAPATSALLQVTAVVPQGAGSIRLAGASVTDFGAGQTVSNLDLVQLGSDGSVSLTVLGATSNVTVDLVGYYSGDLIMPGSTKVLGANLLAAITNLGADYSITFAAGTQVSPPVRLNDVIGAGPSPTTPDGLLRRVLSITNLPDGRTVLGTRPARLPEAITTFSIDWVMPPNGTQAPIRTAQFTRSAASLAPQASSGPFPAPVSTSINPNYPSLALAKPPAGLIIDLSKILGGVTNASELDVNDLELQALPHFTMSVDPSGQVHLAVGFSVGIRAAIELQLLGKLANYDITLLKQVFPVGPLVVVPIAFFFPLVFQPKLEAGVELHFNLNGGFAFGFNVDRFGELEGGYDGANFFGDAVYHDYLTLLQTFTIRPVVQAQVELDLHLIPELTFYGQVISIGAEVMPYLRATVDPTADHWWSVDGGVCRSFQFDLNLILVEKKGQILPACLNVTLAQAGKRLAVTVLPASATVARSGTAHFSAGVVASTHGVTWSIDEGAAGGSLSNANQTDVDYKAPDRAGSYILRAAAIDDPTSFAEAIITVPPTAPSPPQNVTATAGRGSAIVSWSAPADDGGVPITGYQVMVSPGGTVLNATATPTAMSVNGLTPGSSYTFTVTATNSAGLTGPPSSATMPVTVLPLGVMSVSPTTIDFGPVAVGQTSPPQTVQVFADAVTPLTVSSVTLGGSIPGEFAIQSDQCSLQTIPAGGSCAFAVVYKPTIQGLADALVTIVDSDPTSPQGVSLAGHSPVPVTAGIRPIGDIRMVDTQHGYLVHGGGRTTVSPGILGTIDGGRTWSAQPAPSGVVIDAVDLHFVDANHGWTLGCRPGPTSCPSVVVGTKDGGQSWQDLGTVPIGFGPLRIWFSDLQHGWLMGTLGGGFLMGLYATTDGGVTWSQQILPDPYAAGCPAFQEYAGDVRFTDALHGWAVGSELCQQSFTTGGLISQQGLAWTTSDGGLTWTLLKLPANVYALNDFTKRLQVPSANQMRSIGNAVINNSDTTVLVTSDDGGATFSVLPFPEEPENVQFLDGLNGVITTFSGAFYRTADAGNSWVLVGTIPSIESLTGVSSFTRFDYVSAVDANNIWVAGVVLYGNTSAGYVQKSSDGGKTWSVQLLGDGT
jgi:photosystem II stability/assembly factor-like uncharacterized protein